MKKLLLIIAAAITLASCTKQTSHQPLKQQMNYAELSEEIGAQNAFEVFDRSGLTEPAGTPGTSTSRGSKKVKEGATVTVWIDDLELSVTGGVITYSTVPGADFAGVTKFLSQTSNDGALGIWDCNRYWNRLYQAVDPFVTCTDSATAGYFLRAFTSNSTTGEVRISPWVAG